MNAHRAGRGTRGTPGTGTRPTGARLARLGVVSATASRLFGRLVGILLVVVLARSASDQTVAVYGYLLGTATLVVTLTDVGVAAVAGRDVATGRYGAPAALAAALPAQVLAVLAACAVTLGLVAVSSPAGVTAAPVVLTLVFLGLNGMVNLWAELLRGQGRVVVEALLQTLSASLLVVGGLVVIATGGGATVLLAVVAAKELLVLALSWCLLRPRRDPSVRTVQMLRHSVLVALAAASLIVLWRQGTLYIGAVGTVPAVATYVVASRFLDAGVTVASTVGFGLLPGAASIAGDRPAFRALAVRALGLATAIGVVVAVAGTLLAGVLTPLLFGDRWSGATPAVRAFALSGATVLPAYVAWFLLLARRQQRWLVGAAASSAVVAVVVTVLGDRVLTGATAAAVGTTVGSAVLAVVLVTRLLVVLRTAATDPVDPVAQSPLAARNAA